MIIARTELFVQFIVRLVFHQIVATNRSSGVFVLHWKIHFWCI